ncbi:carbonic anhydrase 1-like [Limulus polyphemus]|uniref:Carbonic anhydrase n=1 Tax=Limulus polyphemus TaxID=6850 RepID=A0ABM1B935_LIMPO|nr:carbonic anhydrase 1-like [Limulus polyphemus]
MGSNILVLSLLLFGVTTYAAQHEWGYHGESGPDHWSAASGICELNKQSPINIEKKKAKMNSQLGKISFMGYDRPLQGATIKNNGHTAQLDIKGDERPTIKAGGLGNMYKFLQLHFHWGKSDDRGSEHTVNGKRYPLEMHLVHYNSKYDPSDAINHNDGLAVLGVLFTVSDDDNPNFSTIIDKLSNIQYKDSKVNLDKELKLESLLPNTFPYFRYSGSLTTPPCSEVVTWTVFADTVHISRSQLEQFRNMKEGMANKDSMSLVDNFRPIQALNQRSVQIATESGRHDDKHGGSNKDNNAGPYHFPSLLATIVTCSVTLLYTLK